MARHAGTFQRAANEPLAPVLVTVAYVLNAGMAAGVYAQTMARPLLLGIVGAATITVIAVGFTRNRDMGGLIALLTLVLIGLGGAVGTVLTRTAWWQAGIWLALVVVALGLLMHILRRRGRTRSVVPRSASNNLFASLLLVVVVVTGVANGRVSDFVGDLTASRRPDAPSTAKDDIVVLVLDGYPRADTLTRLFDHDNQPFLDGLEQRDFFVADEARSNYAWTELTLLSMLHMEPAQEVEGFARISRGEVPTQPSLRTLTGRNPAFQHLRDGGYAITTVAPTIDHVALRYVDESHVPPGVSDFEIHLMSSTAIAGLVSMVDPAFFARNQRDQVLWGMTKLDAVATSHAGGRLVLGHVMTPHMPAVFHADGSLREVPFDHRFFYDFRALAGTPRQEWVDSFRDQVTFLNRRVTDVIDHIIEKNPTATVIVMSDHGSGSEFNATAPAKEIDERFGILFAARTPGREGLFAVDQTPVNVFASLLEHHLGLELPRHPDTGYLGYLHLTPLPTAPE